MTKQLQSNYDSKYDVLYVSVVPNEPAIGREDNDGIVIRKSRKTGEFVGVTIFDFKKRLKNNSFPGVGEFIDVNYLCSLI
jgi:uncharacterized protein YuzE